MNPQEPSNRAHCATSGLQPERARARAKRLARFSGGSAADETARLGCANETDSTSYLTGKGKGAFAIVEFPREMARSVRAVSRPSLSLGEGRRLALAPFPRFPVRRSISDVRPE